jgi:hypothetical protein
MKGEGRKRGRYGISEAEAEKQKGKKGQKQKKPVSGIYKYRYTSGESVIKLDRVGRKMVTFFF